MTRWMLLLVALLAASPAWAVLDELAVRFWPDLTEFTERNYVQASVWTNSNRAVYRAEVFQRAGQSWVAADPGAVWLGRFPESFGEGSLYLQTPGEYRLVLHASEGPGTPEISVSKRFRVVASDSEDYAVARDRRRIVAVYEYARDCWQDYLANLRRRQFLMMDLSYDVVPGGFGHVFSIQQCVPGDYNNEGAPGGGEKVMLGQPGDGDATGAVVFTDRSTPAWPATPDELHQFALAITSPAWPGVPDLVRRTEVVAWEPGVVDPTTLISNLSLRVHPYGDLFALDGTPIPMWATVDGGKASFAYELERWDGANWQHEEAWQGSSQVRWQPRRAGQYRVRVTASEEGAPTVLQRTRTFRVIGPRHPDFARVSAQNRVDRNFEVTLAYVRNGLYSVKRKLRHWSGSQSEFESFNESQHLALAIGGYEWGGGYLMAPGGGPAFIGGVAGDGDATGAIVLEVLAAPPADDNWEGTAVRIHYPAYAPAGAQRRSVDVRY